MGLLDSIASKSFRDAKIGRVVVFPGDRRNRAYLVRSESEELKSDLFSRCFNLLIFPFSCSGCC